MPVTGVWKKTPPEGAARKYRFYGRGLKPVWNYDEKVLEQFFKYFFKRL